jgi:hypothetical protein
MILLFRTSVKKGEGVPAAFSLDVTCTKSHPFGGRERPLAALEKRKC